MRDPSHLTCVRGHTQGSLVNEETVEMHRDRGMFEWKGGPLNGTPMGSSSLVRILHV
jgi:hypothetical protein